MSVLPPRPTRHKAGLFTYGGSGVFAEPSGKRAVAFVDGQNLYHAARQAFGYTYPNYDVQALAAAICESHTWILTETRFYTGVPDPADNAGWHAFWVTPTSRNVRGIDKTDWIRIDRSTYDACVDRRDCAGSYRPDDHVAGRSKNQDSFD